MVRSVSLDIKVQGYSAQVRAGSARAAPWRPLLLREMTSPLCQPLGHPWAFSRARHLSYAG